MGTKGLFLWGGLYMDWKKFFKELLVEVLTAAALAGAKSVIKVIENQRVDNCGQVKLPE
jgi:hypothetical protein